MERVLKISFWISFVTFAITLDIMIAIERVKFLGVIIASGAIMIASAYPFVMKWLSNYFGWRD